MSELKTFAKPEAIQLVEFTQLEFTFMREGKTGHYFAEVALSYVPDEKCLDAASFTEYLNINLRTPTSAEALAAQITHDVKAVLRPLWLKVVIRQSPKNGLVAETTALWQHEPELVIPAPEWTQ